MLRKSWLPRCLQFAFFAGRSRRLRCKTSGLIQTCESRLLLSASPAGSEFQVNTYTTGVQQLSGFTTQAVVSDADGDFVVTWSSNAQDGSLYGIFAQRYNAAGVAQGSEFQVNTYTTDNQRFAAVAMDADGDFVVTWTSYGQDGSNGGIFAQRYNAAGVAQGSEFQVNTYTTGNQQYSTVAMDADGDFVVTWTSSGQDGSSGGIFAQRYNAAGVAQGSEFQVNTYTTSSQGSSTVAMDADGDFVITWTSLGQDGSGYGVFAQRYNTAGVAQGSEFQVNTSTLNQQRYSSVAMDADGDFVVTWSSLNQDGSNYGIFAQRYNAAGVAQGSEFQVNTYTTNSQTLSRVAMDADGDFVITWMSSGQDGSNYGIFAQQYSAAGVAQGSEFRVNTYTTSNQLASAVTMDADGDFVVIWMSFGQDGDTNGIFAQRYDESTDTAGPTVTDLLVDGNHVAENAQLLEGPTTMTVVFSENLATTGSGSVIDTSNWSVLRNGVEQPGRINNISFNFNMATNKYEAIVTFATEPLAVGTYQLVAKETITDVAGNMLDGDRDGTPGSDFTRQFRVSDIVTAGGEFQVNTYTTLGQRTQLDSPRSVAMDANGNFVATWTSFGQDGGVDGVFAQRYNSAGVAQGSEFQVNTYTTSSQGNSTVAMDADGDFVITWTSFVQDGNGFGVFAQRYNAVGVAQGSEFLVNTYTTGDQRNSTVAMDSDGDFVITWTSEGQDGSGYGIFAQRYNAAGVAQGSEFQVNTYTTSDQQFAAVAMDSDGDFVITWTSFGQDGSSNGVFAQRYTMAGVAQGSEFQVNTYTTETQSISTVAMSENGDFVVTWESYDQDGDGFGIFAQRYNAAGVAQGSEFQVNTDTTSDQRFATVALDADGDFVVSWSSDSQDGSGYGIFARRYNSAGVVLGSEFQVNTYTTSNQLYSTVAMDADGDFVVTWTSYGQDLSSSGVYAQRYRGNVAPIVPTTQSLMIDENSSFGTNVGTVTATDADPTDTLTYSFSGGNVGNAFAINASTGEITVNKPYLLNFEALTSFSLRVAATDTAGQTRKSTVTVNINDANEQPLVSPQTFSIIENSPAGTSVGTVMASDPDAMNTLSYAITGGNLGKAFAINSATGAITVNKPAAIDFETLNSFEITVQVTDGGGLSRKAVMTINVNDLNEQPLISPQTFNVDENSPNGTSVGTVVASDPDAMDTLTYAITGGNIGRAFAINATTGEITVSNSLALDFETTPTFSITVQVTDSHGLSRKAVMTINLNNVAEFNSSLLSDEEGDLFSTMSSLLSF
ncbi:hypothetical protein GC163_16260 [bacterium]|nr:hypothetical protein [bacterium]